MCVDPHCLLRGLDCRQEKGLEPAGVAQWIEHQTVMQRVAGSIPSQGTCTGFGPGPPQ